MKRLRTLAMYLPQFHTLPENDEWWGEGFTDWTTVKAAERLFEDHNQVREPLNGNYYDLMKKETMEWQAELAAKYGIDGFCFYHYYFKDGRKILEKPAENLLQWKDIYMPFCFCWANETWARTWSNISYSNAWSEKFEKEGDSGTTVLLEQNYGERSDWEKHFEYLLPFFKDERYIRVKEKPVFLFYKPEDIAVLSEMLLCWNTMAQENGYQGIYAIGVNISQRTDGLDAILYQGPNAYIVPYIAGKKVQEKWNNGIKTYDYQSIWDNAIAVDAVKDIKTYFGAFVDYDDTPRRGKLGTCTLNVSPKSFEENLFNIAVKNIAFDNELLFINAWNEWGEGNYLEPDKKNGYAYLEAVRHVTNQCNDNEFDAKIMWSRLTEGRQVNTADDEKQALVSDLNKFRMYYKLLDRWLLLKEQGKSVEGFFLKNGYEKIAIYGMAALGRHLYEELKNSSVEVVYALDRRRGLQCGQLEVRSPDEEIYDCDIIVVTAAYDFENIVKEIEKKTDIPVVSLQDVIFY